MPERPLTLITGGAGFIGGNLAHRLLSQGAPVLVLDDISRVGAERNLTWLRARHPGELLVVEIADVRDVEAVRRAVQRADRIFHLVAHRAATAGGDDPLRDFEINTRGTLNVLEAARARQRPPPLLFASTSRVYGELADLRLEQRGRRYVPADARLADAGVDERWPLAFQGPRGCSQGAADQYVLAYARSFGLPAAVLRMSCVYGPQQCGGENAGWIAHFLERARDHRLLTIHGDGCQVRDILFVDDLVDALLLAMRGIDRLAGQAFNIGGGPQNSLSPLELLDIMAGSLGLAVRMEHAAWRSGEPRYYATNSGKFSAATGWLPAISVAEGVGRLYEWLLSLDPGQLEPPGSDARGGPVCAGDGGAEEPGSALGPP